MQIWCGDRVRRVTLWTRGRRDQIDTRRIDQLIKLLRQLASPEGAGGIQIGELVINAVRDFGGVLVAHTLWQELGLDRLLRQSASWPPLGTLATTAKTGARSWSAWQSQKEGLPIMQRVFKDNTTDITTLAPVAKELHDRFGVRQPVLVGDKGMFSDANLEALEADGFRYVLSLRDRSDSEGAEAIQLALKSGLPIPKGCRGA